MGDVLHGLPALAGLRSKRPGCFVGWAIEPRWKGLLAGVDHIHEVRTRSWKQRPFSIQTVREIVALRREMRAERYDVCVDLQGSIRSSVIGWMSGARLRVGPAEPREWPARWLYGERVEPHAVNVIAQACELLGAGLRTRLAPARVELPVDAAAEDWFSARFGACRGFVLLVTGAGWGAKQWPVESFRTLAAELRAAGRRVLVSATSAGDERAVAIGAEAVICNLAELVALTRRAALVIGGDTGPPAPGRGARCAGRDAVWADGPGAHRACLSRRAHARAAAPDEPDRSSEAFRGRGRAPETYGERGSGRGPGSA